MSSRMRTDPRIAAFRDLDAAFARIFTRIDIADTRLADTLGTLPIPAHDIPPAHGRRIAENVALDLTRIGYRGAP